jgi:hypothetical protein
LPVQALSKSLADLMHPILQFELVVQLMVIFLWIMSTIERKMVKMQMMEMMVFMAILFLDDSQTLASA